MELTIVIAKLFAIYFVVSGLAVLFRKKTLVHAVKDMYEHPAIMWLGGALLIFLGGYIVLVHNVWEGTLATWVTVLAWLTLIKGVAYMLLPDKLARLGSQVKSWWAPLGLVMIVLGVWLFMAAK